MGLESDQHQQHVLEAAAQARVGGVDVQHDPVDLLQAREGGIDFQHDPVDLLLNSWRL